MLGRLVACLDVKAVGRNSLLLWPIAGGRGGGRTRVGEAVVVVVVMVGGQVADLVEGVFDGITSTGEECDENLPER